MHSRLLVLTVCLASVMCDRFQDYNKFPNRRFGDPTNSGYGGGGRGTYDGSSTYDRDGQGGYGAGGVGYGGAGGVGYGTGGGAGYGTGGAGYGTGGAGYGTGGAGYGTGGYAGGYEDYGAEGYGRRDYCRNRTAQMDIRMDELMGMWYGVEIIPHLAGNPGTYMDDTCVVIHIAELTNEPSTESSYYYSTLLQRNWSKDYRHLRLVWDEAGRDVEYSLYFRRDAVGFWNSEAEQNGTLPTYRSYKPFSGTVQVLKAVNDHLLLHFCQAATDGRQAQLFSVLLSREPRRLERWEVESAHDLLRRKNLSITTRRLVCGNSAAVMLPSLLVAFALLVAVLHRAL